jgi:hypothetical protein
MILNGLLQWFFGFLATIAALAVTLIFCVTTGNLNVGYPIVVVSLLAFVTAISFCFLLYRKNHKMPGFWLGMFMSSCPVVVKLLVVLLY